MGRTVHVYIEWRVFVIRFHSYIIIYTHTHTRALEMRTLYIIDVHMYYYYYYYVFNAIATVFAKKKIPFNRSHAAQ